MSDNLVQKMLSVQNAAARLVTGTRRCEHITAVLKKLYCLPIRRRVKFKLACLVHQSLAGQTLTYLCTDIQLTADTGSLSSYLHQRGYVSFHAHTAASVTQVSLLPVLVCGTPCHYLRQDMSYRHFKRAPKLHIFRS